MFGGHGGGFAMGAGYMGLIWIAIVIALVIAVWWLINAVRTSGSRRDTTDGSESPEEILRGRFARGEIDEEEFHRRATALKH